MAAPDWNEIRLKARVPEHSLPLMQAMGGSEAACIDNYIFYYADDWLAGIGYPLEGRFSHESFMASLNAAENEFKPERIFVIAPELPASLEPNIIEKDRYYLLPAIAPVPAKLRNPVKKAGKSLRIEISRSFTPGHRKLWAEFLSGAKMNERVLGLYARTPEVAGKDGLFLLDARDADGNLAASLLLDANPANFISYILGAHSRQFYTPHATDLLFAEMPRLAQKQNKRFIHLGLGVNDGILRFKKKWGCLPGRSFIMAQWETEARRPEAPVSRLLAQSILSQGSYSARKFIQNEPSQRPFAMLWQIEKNNRVSWLAGTAHFFLHSFEVSFRNLFRQVDNVIFEGPLDAAFMQKVEAAGREPPQKAPLIASLNESEIRKLELTVNGSNNLLSKALGQKQGRVDVRWLLSGVSTWYAFFTLWTSFLERLGWRQSVDMEAWRIAIAMNKNISGMETLEEQLESLDSLPEERALNFFRACGSWKARAAANLRAYLAGDLEKMMGSSAEFPTRTEHIVSRRDQRFRERMRPWLEKGGSAIFVGSAHIVNLRGMLREDGFKVRQAPAGLWPKIQLAWRQLSRPDEKVQW